MYRALRRCNAGRKPFLVWSSQLPIGDAPTEMINRCND
ncbi:hypothetical protein ALP8811_02798 [Aliiroseovarius pelagivivens]|uniref:Uncharacterized protein n=1 Tax=Aliiroseovarius pelagivivens TaxID=1639690 RepID=A0A2R8AS22_9RHOB|nr:hypothetical protein ALP8811_02798 [Aliiroseovarius pelagivivens]